jgi:hypothetical protein
MERNLKYERLFPLGQYVNAKFIDEIIGIPEKVCLNQNLINELRYLQMVDVELAYRTYLKLSEKAHTLDLEELAKSLEFLETERKETLVKIETILNTEGE